MEELASGDRLELLDRDECLRLLADGGIGRLGFVVAGQPRIEPVNYRLLDGVLLIASRPGSKLDAAEQRQRVAFEIDSVEEWSRSGWSVLATGTASVVTDADEEWTALLADGPEVWAPVPGLSLIRVVVDELTGRRVGFHPGGVSVVVQEPDAPRPAW